MYLFTIIFVSKLVSNLCKNFLFITRHQKLTVYRINQFFKMENPKFENFFAYYRVSHNKMNKVILL